MSFMVAQPAIRLPVPTLAVGAICPALVVGGFTTALWWSGSEEAGIAALLGAVVSVLVAIGWVVAMSILPARPAARWSLVLVLSSSARMMISLVVALGVYLAFQPLKAPFWASFLAASLATLAVETMVSLSALKRAAAGAGTEDSVR